MLVLLVEQVSQNMRVIVQHRSANQLTSGESADRTYSMKVPSTSERSLFVDRKNSQHIFVIREELLGTATFAE